MDALVQNAQGVITGSCDWNGPTADDNADINWLYFMNAAHAQPEILPSVKLNSTQIRNPWRDHSPTERAYFLYRQYLWGNTVYTFQTIAHEAGLAPGDPWAVTDLIDTFTKTGSTPSNTFYRTCMYLYSGVIGYRYWRCFNWVYLEG